MTPRELDMRGSSRKEAEMMLVVRGYSQHAHAHAGTAEGH